MTTTGLIHSLQNKFCEFYNFCSHFAIRCSYRTLGNSKLRKDLQSNDFSGTCLEQFHKESVYCKV